MAFLKWKEGAERDWESLTVNLCLCNWSSLIDKIMCLDEKMMRSDILTMESGIL